MQEKIPELKASVESLRERLDDMFFKDMTPTSVRSTVSNDSCQSSEKHHNELKYTPISVNCQLANRQFQNSCRSSEICQNASSSVSSQLRNRYCQSSKHTTKTSVKTGSKHTVHSVKNQHENMYCSSQKLKPMSLMKNNSVLLGSVIKETPSNYKNEKNVEVTSQNKPNISISNQNSTQLNSSVILPVIKSNTLQNPVTTHQSRMYNISDTFTPAIRSSTLANPITVKQHVKSSANSLHKHAVLNCFSQTTDSFSKVESHNERKSQNENGTNFDGSGDSILQQNENQGMQSSVFLQNKCLLLSHITSNLKQDSGRNGRQSGCLECGAVCVCGQTAIASCVQYKDESHGEESSLLHIVQEDTNQSLVSCCDTKAYTSHFGKADSYEDNIIKRSEQVENAEFSSSEMGIEKELIDADELSVDHFPATFLEYPDLFSPAVTGIESQDSGISNDTSVKSIASGFEQGSHFGQFSKIGESVVNEKVLSNIRDDNDDYDLKEIGSESRFIEDLTKSETLEHHIDDKFKESDGFITIQSNLSQSQELQYHVIDDYQDCDSIITISSVNTQDVPNLSLNESTYSVEHEDKIPQVTKHITGGKVSPKRVRFHFGT